MNIFKLISIGVDFKETKFKNFRREIKDIHKKFTITACGYYRGVAVKIVYRIQFLTDI
jgi:hypothetical protein